jgi:hypothetical protein
VAAPGLQRLATGAILVLAAGVAIAAVVSGFATDRSSTPSAAPANSPASPARPAAGDLRDLPPPPLATLSGSFVLISPSCTVQGYDLRTGRTQSVSNVGTCEGWFSPSGSKALVVQEAYAGPQAPLLHLDLTSGEASPTRLQTGTDYQGPPAAADDGGGLSCTDSGLMIEEANGHRTTHRELCPATVLGRRMVALASDEQSIIDARTGERLYPFDHPPRHGDAYFAGLVASPDARRLGVVAFDNTAGLSQVTRIDPRTGRSRPPVPLAVFNRYIRLSLSNDGRLLAVLNEGGWEVWNLDRGTQFRRVGGQAVEDVAFSPDSRFIAVATGVGVAILDGPTLAPRYLLPVLAHRLTWIARSAAIPPAQ